jgi:hypothetical protein
MSAKKINPTLLTGLLGLLTGLGMSAYVHSGNAFETGPFFFFSLALSALAVVGCLLMIVLGKRGDVVFRIAIFFGSIIFSLIVVPRLWPYPEMPGPVPLSDQPTSVAPK